jgi:hypothetical protein
MWKRRKSIYRSRPKGNNEEDRRIHRVLQKNMKTRQQRLIYKYMKKTD